MPHALNGKIATHRQSIQDVPEDGSVEPVVVLPIGEEPYNLQKDDEPEERAEPVDGNEWQRFHEAEVLSACHEEYQHERQQGDDEHLHSLPCPEIVSELLCRKTRQTHIAQYYNVQ